MHVLSPFRSLIYPDLEVWSEGGGGGGGGGGEVGRGGIAKSLGIKTVKKI